MKPEPIIQSFQRALSTTSHPLGWLYSNTDSNKVLEKLEPSHTARETIKATWETSLVVPQKPKYRSSNSTPGI